MNYVNLWDETCNSFHQCAHKTAWCQGISPLLLPALRCIFCFQSQGFFYLNKSSYKRQHFTINFYMALTSKMNLELPKFVFCFCQKLSGFIIRATWISAGKASWRVFRRGLIKSHLDPRISIITVNPRLQTSSLQE